MVLAVSPRHVISLAKRGRFRYRVRFEVGSFVRYRREQISADGRDFRVRACSSRWLDAVEEVNLHLKFSSTAPNKGYA